MGLGHGDEQGTTRCLWQPRHEGGHRSRARGAAESLPTAPAAATSFEGADAAFSAYLGRYCAP